MNLTHSLTLQSQSLSLSQMTANFNGDQQPEPAFDAHEATDNFLQI